MKSIAPAFCLFGLALAPMASAQFRLSLEGGSVPGTLTMRAGPFIPDGRFGVVLISVRTADIPLFPLDPTDTRSLGVGLELGSVSRSGQVMNGAGLFDGTPMTIPNQANFIDGALYFQSLYIPGNTRFFGPLSPVKAVRFGPANSFHSRGVQMTTPRSFFPTVELEDGRVMMAGGGAGAILAQVATSRADVYDPITDSFSQVRFMRSPRSLHTATRAPDGRILLIGGVDVLNDPSDTMEWFDPIIDSFFDGPSMAEPRMGHTATMLPTGHVLVAGGISDLNQPTSQLDPIYSTLATTEVFDPFTNQWSPGPAMSAPRVGHAAIPLPNGNVMLIGGAGYVPIGGGYFLPTIERSVDIYDPFTNQITPGPSMSDDRALFSYTDLGGGEFLVAGGISNFVLSPVPDMTPTNSAEIYDSTTNMWRSVSAMAAPRAFAAVYPIGLDRYLHIGGGGNSVLSPVPLDTTEVYDKVADQWSPGPTLPQPLAAFGHYRNETGQVHILGGSSTGIPAVVSSTLWFYGN